MPGNKRDPVTTKVQESMADIAAAKHRHASENQKIAKLIAQKFGLIVAEDCR